MSTIQRDFELIKFLHNPHTSEEIKNEFGISDSSESHIFDERKIVFNNVEFPMYKRKVRGENRFVSDASTKDMLENELDPMERETVHPVILPLNMMEVNALTNHLLKLSANDELYHGVYYEIAEKIYLQLSDYGKNQIRGNYLFPSLDLNKKVQYTHNGKNIKNDIIYAHKATKKIIITLKSGETIVGYAKELESNYYLVPDCMCNDRLSILEKGKAFNLNDVDFVDIND